MERSPELEEYVRDCLRRIQAGESSVIGEIWSHHESVSGFGTDPAENWRGYKEIVSTWTLQRTLIPKQQASILEDIQGWADRGVGWVTLRSRSIEESGREVPLRSTMIFRLERGRWKMIHFHMSAGVTNEALFGYSLPTTIDAMTIAMEHEEASVHPVVGPDGTATILFTDIEDSTVLNERLGDEAWMDLLRHHNGIVRRQVSAEHGLEVKNQGDGFMLAFADPAAATRAAIAIQRAFTTESDGEVIRVRIGGHAGTTVVESDDFFGRTVVMAARIAGAARGGEILVSDAVREKLAGDEFNFGKPLQLSLKGFSGSHTVHRIDWGPR